MRKAVSPTESVSEACQCPYTIAKEARQTKMVFDCREEPGPARLTDRSCRIRVLEALGREFAVNAVVLSDFVETQYASESLQLLLKLTELSQDLKRLGLRDPYATYFASQKALSSSQKTKQRETCKECRFNPRRMFPGLDASLKANVVKTYANFGKGADALKNAQKPAVCDPCLEASGEDFDYLFGRIEDLRGHILYHGFKILESGGG